jgi:hypothetical protein
VRIAKYSAFVHTVVCKDGFRSLCFHCVVFIDCRMLKAIRLGDWCIPNLVTFG